MSEFSVPNTEVSSQYKGSAAGGCEYVGPITGFFHPGVHVTIIAGEREAATPGPQPGMTDEAGKKEGFKARSKKEG